MNYLEEKEKRKIFVYLSFIYKVFNIIMIKLKINFYFFLLSFK
jgi:hypothetical protein